MTIEWAAKADPFILYTGTNSSDVCDAIEEFRPGSTATVVSETGGVLEVDVSTPDYPTDNYHIGEGERFGLTTGQQPDSTVWANQYAKP